MSLKPSPNENNTKKTAAWHFHCGDNVKKAHVWEEPPEPPSTGKKINRVLSISTPTVGIDLILSARSGIKFLTSLSRDLSSRTFIWRMCLLNRRDDVPVLP